LTSRSIENQIAIKLGVGSERPKEDDVMRIIRFSDTPDGGSRFSEVVEGPVRAVFMRVPDDFNVQEWTR
jgi:hypothetical protein